MHVCVLCAHVNASVCVGIPAHKHVACGGVLESECAHMSGNCAGVNAQQEQQANGTLLQSSSTVSSQHQQQPRTPPSASRSASRLGSQQQDQQHRQQDQNQQHHRLSATPPPPPPKQQGGLSASASTPPSSQQQQQQYQFHQLVDVEQHPGIKALLAYVQADRLGPKEAAAVWSDGQAVPVLLQVCLFVCGSGRGIADVAIQSSIAQAQHTLQYTLTLTHHTHVSLPSHASTPTQALSPPQAESRLQAWLHCGQLPWLLQAAGGLLAHAATAAEGGGGQMQQTQQQSNRGSEAAAAELQVRLDGWIVCGVFACMQLVCVFACA